MRVKFLLVLLIAALLLTACGKKGPVKPKPAASQAIQLQLFCDPLNIA